MRIGFVLECSCGRKTDGAFFEDDYSEVLHCNCGKVWVIARPYEPLGEKGEGQG